MSSEALSFLDKLASLRVAVLLPCYNEEVAIARTVAAFRESLPGATIYVYDNNSRDATIAVAREAGAVVRIERMQGKGNVVRRMFADVDADIYILSDGDLTYDATAAPALIQRLLDEQLDMVVGARKSEIELAYRRGHRFGNRMLTGMLARLFGRSFSDILSGYRVFSRRFVKSFPVLSSGFEIETEISIHALELRMPVAEVITAYAARPRARHRSFPPIATAGGSCGRSSTCSGSSVRSCFSGLSGCSHCSSRSSSRSRSRSPMRKPGWSRACPPRCSSPALESARCSASSRA
jgi:glycosyltransferase involved in cell wall biosynthesis